MCQEIKNRLDCLVDLHNEIYLDSIQSEVEIILRDDENKRDTTSPEIMLLNSKEMSIHAASLKDQRDRLRILNTLIVEETDRKSVSKDN